MLTLFSLVAPVTLPSAHASPGGVVQVAPPARPVTDFDGDGKADLAVGAPGEDLGGIVDAGAVTVRISGVGWRSFTQNSAAASGTAERNDHFGAALAAGDFDNDGFTDLAVGAPGEDVGPVSDAGVLNVLRGSASGLVGSGGQVFTQNSPGVPSSAERGDQFAYALTAADFNNDGFDDLAIGVRGEDGAAVDGGAVNVLYGAVGGLTGKDSRLFTQNNAGTANAAEAGDLFGSTLAAGDFDFDGFADLAIGVPHEDVFAVDNAGAVNVLRGSAGGLTGAGGQLFTQDSPGIAGSAEAGDAFGTALATIDYGGFGQDGFADLAIGVPDEDVFAAANAGAAHVLRGSASGLTGIGSRQFTENSSQFSDQAEAGDLFGSSLVAVDFHGVGDSLVIGAPGEDVGSAVDAGMVYIDSWGITENSPNMAGVAQSGDRFGDSLAAIAGQPPTLVIGVPGEGGASGAVMFIVGHLDDGDQLPSTGSLTGQSSPWIPGVSEPGDFFGDALVGS